MTCWDFEDYLLQWFSKTVSIRDKHSGKQLLILSLGRLKQLNFKFEASLSYIMRLCLKKILIYYNPLEGQKINSEGNNFHVTNIKCIIRKPGIHPIYSYRTQTLL